MNISKENKFLTLINVFTVEAENQRRLTELLVKATKESVQHIDGFIAAALHRSMDGTRVTMYAQWKSREHYQRMRSNPQASPYLDEVLTIAKFEPGMYEVAEVFNGD